MSCGRLVLDMPYRQKIPILIRASRILIFMFQV